LKIQQETGFFEPQCIVDYHLLLFRAEVKPIYIFMKNGL